MSSYSDSETMLPSLRLDVLGQRGNATPTPIPKFRSERRAGPGDMIGGRYIIDGQIGRGGMGRVLRVRHMVLDKAFALKLPRARYAMDAQERERFYREARMSSAMVHDNICSIVDFGDDPIFGLFMVMDLLEGQTLKDKLKSDGGMSAKAAAAVMMQIAEALRYVHSKGIIHGDIKSDNIFLVRTADRHRVVKLLDFGLARPRASKSDGTVHGTPEYLAPERIRKGAPTVASDIYALGILFYELLVGLPPFTGDPRQVLQSHLDQEIDSPSTLISGEIDERADLIVKRSTDKVPEQRHPNVSAFIYELRAFCTMHGISTGRRSDAGSLVRKAADHAAKAGAEIFEEAPVPLAAVSRDGSIRVANRAFLSFLGQTTLDNIRLPQTALLKVYPELIKDLYTVATTGATIKKTFNVGAGEGQQQIMVAIILSSPPSDNCNNSGDIHVALHPLGVVSG